jgi:methionine synthase II (cobalamin-independent)
MLAGFKEAGEDADALLEAYIKLYNDSISSRPADMHLGIHLCRGNFAYSRHFSEGGYDRVARKLFNEINADTYFLEYDTDRAGGFEPLKELPAHKNVILGVVTSKFPELEDVGKMKERVFQAADYVAAGAGQTREEALRRMGVSPQCGFASHHLGNSVTREDMIKKLQLVRKLADEIWPGEP